MHGLSSSLTIAGEERQELIARLDELNEALGDAATALVASQAMNRAFRENIANGEPLDDTMAAVSASDGLASVGRELKHLEEARHRSRTAVFAVALAEGISIGKLGRLYGFSRQLAQRFAKEARDQRGKQLVSCS
jgi:hypothetical protein